MKLSDILSVTQSTIYGISKRTRPYTAKLLGHEESAPTKDEAILAAVKAVQAQIANTWDETVRFTKDGSCWVLNYKFGWQYTIYGNGRTCGSGCRMNVTTKSEAIEAMEQHIMQYDAPANQLETMVRS